MRTRLALSYATATVALGAVPVAVAGFGTWTGRSTQPFGAAATSTVSNTPAVLATVAVGLIVVALAAAPIGWALAGRALRPLRELTSAAAGATADRLPGHGELGRYEEFADLSATLAGLYARLDAAYAAQRRFVADASHELRTPLTVQRALIQVTLADPDADEATLRAVCAELLQVGDQLERLVTSLLALAQGDSRVAEPVDLAALTVASDTAGRTVRTDLQRAVVARADPALLASLIGNLLDNAIRYNVDGGHVEVETRTAGAHAVLSVRNTGPVVPADAVEKILAPFARLGPSGDGSGLGLAIVAAIADHHGADLRVVPNPGGGLAITVSFPAA
ncbi:sensor histidine kinase [Paractinoplanes durhamensis]|uniref:sensor histidine kinase n=1 Tax=Paractinoplanes durhamensis TaxID=113563 RepID=UPI0019440F5B|nr:HAMP domain-containing sensor histidine kinase [Actinoplanes durhamensis]